ncbi:hypothetical protein [Nostoc sp. KVJ20]|nr:hypothetical protein [Nostoc sp. KVJ20]
MQDLEALIQLRLELLREAGDIKGDGKRVYEKPSFVSASKEMEIV